jgi:RNA polymerase sigma-70 factor, ECF subfamily
VCVSFEIAVRQKASVRSARLPREPRHEFDRAYLDRLAAGDPETERHFTAYFGQLLTIKLRSRLRSPALIEDAKQETFLRVLNTLRQKGGVQSAGGFGAFVNTVCNNVLFELYRSESRASPLEDEVGARIPDAATDIESTMTMDQDRARVRSVMASLPDKEKQLLHWLFFEEIDKDEVCRRLGIDRDYLRVLLHRAKLRFKAEFVAS